jgi:hypothetical protein
LRYALIFYCLRKVEHSSTNQKVKNVTPTLIVGVPFALFTGLGFPLRQVIEIAHIWFLWVILNETTFANYAKKIQPCCIKRN